MVASVPDALVGRVEADGRVGGVHDREIPAVPIENARTAQARVPWHAAGIVIKDLAVDDAEITRPIRDASAIARFVMADLAVSDGEIAVIADTSAHHGNVVVDRTVGNRHGAGTVVEAAATILDLVVVEFAVGDGDGAAKIEEASAGLPGG